VPLLCGILIDGYYFYDNQALTKKQIKCISFDYHTLGNRQNINDITKNILQPIELTLRPNTNATWWILPLHVGLDFPFISRLSLDINSYGLLKR
ncbi:hypothetical protein ACMWME_26790, partial [Escherichia coli]